jgi:signal transduction histidine kinase
MPATRSEIIFIISIISLFIVVMVTFVVIILFFIQKKQKGFITDLNTVKVNYEKELYKVQLEIQEQTFQEIAMEIHDNVGQLITLAKFGISALDFDKKEEAISDSKNISAMLGKATEDLRHMSRSMNSKFINNRGLTRSIEMQVEYLQRSADFITYLHVNGQYVKLNETKEVILFRILQEAINNIIKHAAATEINITLTYSKEILILSIQDNGRGFHFAEMTNGAESVNGISNMQHRARLIDAGFQIDSKPGNGTTVIVTTSY